MKNNVKIKFKYLKKIEVKEQDLNIPIFKFLEKASYEISGLYFDPCKNKLVIRRKYANKNQLKKLIPFLIDNTSSFTIKMKKTKLKIQTTTP